MSDFFTGFALTFLRLGLAVWFGIFLWPLVIGSSPAWQKVGTSIGKLFGFSGSIEVFGFLVTMMAALATVSLGLGFFTRLGALVLSVFSGLFFWIFLMGTSGGLLGNISGFYPTLFQSPWAFVVVLSIAFVLIGGGDWSLDGMMGGGKSGGAKKPSGEDTKKEPKKK